MNFVTWSIRNPVPVIVMFIALTVAGIVSFPKLGVLDRPDIEFPAIVVTVGYSGVAPSQMESEITRKVEDAVPTGIHARHAGCPRGVRHGWARAGARHKRTTSAQCRKMGQAVTIHPSRREDRVKPIQSD